MEADQSTFRLRAELERVGASFRKAGVANYISLTDFGQSVSLSGPPRQDPRPSWRGPHSQAVELLAPLPDDAGVAAVWQALSAL